MADNIVFLRGQVGQDLRTAESVGIGDPAAQARQAMDNVETLLAEAGARLEDVCKLVIYLTDAAYREPVYKVVGSRLRGVFPVSTGTRRQRLGSRPSGWSRSTSPPSSRGTGAPDDPDARSPRRVTGATTSISSPRPCGPASGSSPPSPAAARRGAALALIRELGDGAGTRGGRRRRRQPSRTRARLARQGRRARRGAAGAPRHGVRARPIQPVRPGDRRDRPSASKATGSARTARRWARTTASAWPPCRPSRRATLRTAPWSSCSRRPRRSGSKAPACWTPPPSVAACCSTSTARRTAS